MDPEKTKRRQSLKVIISEAIMVITVIITVIILAFLVSGYWINPDFQIERQGLLQISSTPTGASINIDGEDSPWFQRTNTSKVLSSGKHTITLSKEGYDSWTKTINISEGLLYRIHYPRLFLNDRDKEELLDTSGTTMATMSPDHNYLLLINNTTLWNLIDLDNENIKSTEIDISSFFSDASIASGTKAGIFNGEILRYNWDSDGNHILFNVKNNDSSTEWVLLDVKNPKNSLNLTKEFGSNFNNIEIVDNSSNNLLAVRDGNLHRINIPSKTISSVIVENIINFDHYTNEIIFSAKNSNDQNKSEYYVGLLQSSNDKIIKLEYTANPAKAVLSKFYDDKYITILENDLISLYKKEDFIKISDFKLSFNPKHIEVGHNGEFIIAYSDSQIATLDMESMSVIEWSTDTSNLDWLDNDMIYDIKDSELIVYDYDGLNRRSISNGVSSHFPAGITNDKWLYYFSDNQLVRESLTK